MRHRNSSRRPRQWFRASAAVACLDLSQCFLIQNRLPSRDRRRTAAEVLALPPWQPAHATGGALRNVFGAPPSVGDPDAGG